MAAVTLHNWLHVSDDSFINYIRQMATEHYGSLEAWIAANPELQVHPRDTVESETLGMHQDWACNLMPFRYLRIDGYDLYLFEYQLGNVLS